MKHLILAALVMVTGVAWGRAPLGPGKVDPPNRCALVDQAYFKQSVYSMNEQASLARKAMPLLTGMDMMVSKVKSKNPQETIAQILSPVELKRFDQMRDRLAYLRFRSLLLSRATRDMKVLSHLCHASLKANGLAKRYLAKHKTLASPYGVWFRGQIAAVIRQAKHPVYLRTLLFLRSQVRSNETKQNIKIVAGEGQ